MQLYVTEQGAVISKKEGQLIVSKGGTILEKIPAQKLDKICLLGNINLTTQAMNYLLDKEIDVIFMSSFGKYRGKLYKDEYRNVLLRLKQYERANDMKFKTMVSREIVKGKLRNCYDFLIIRSKRLTKGTLSQEIASIRKIMENLEKSDDIDKIRGFEGIGAKFYFEGLKKLIKNDKFKFEKRIAHPPKDRINCLLSFGYSLLYNEIMAAMNIVGVDPYFGNLHTVEISKKALLFDMVEEYRNLIIDDTILNAVNRGEFNESHFIDKEKGVVHMTHEGMKLFIAKFEGVIAGRRKYHLDEEMNYTRTIFEKQIRHYARVVLGDDEKYCPFYRVRNS